MKKSSTWLVVFAAMLLVYQCAVFSSDQFKLTVGHWAFEDIHAQNLSIDLKLTHHGLLTYATADSIELPQPIGLLKKVSLQCKELVFLSSQLSCTAGNITFSHKVLGSQKIAFTVKAAAEKEHYQFSVSNLFLAEAKFSIIANVDKSAWRASIETSHISLEKLRFFLSPYLEQNKKEMLTGWTLDSDLAVKATMNGYAEQLENLKLDLDITHLNVSDSQGKYVTENLSMRVLADLKQTNQAWQWHADIQLESGQAYGEPIFIDFNESTMAIAASGEWQQADGHLIISDALIKQGELLEVKGHFSGNVDQIQELEVDIKPADLNHLYSIWLQPFALGTAADKLELAGKVGLMFKQKAETYDLSVDLKGVFIDDQKSRFGVYDLNGNVAWTNNDTVTHSELSWQGGYVYAVPFGQSNLQLEAYSSSLKLLKPWTLPILDGALMVNEFSLQHSGEEKTQWMFDGLLTPISMESLSAALDWPILHGKLSGVIPKVSYVNQQVKVDGALMVKLFEGTTVIRDLRLNKPFGSLPQLYANVDLKGLDLEILTQTFDFGKITGKLDGYLNDLRLSNWQPVQFDAHFATPDGDKSRRRISQKAIDNLSQIGGGVGGALSRSFLRFFEDFSYEKLGLNCKLLNETCAMSGVDEAKQGYYIVKGGGLPPRINVVGYTRQVDWPDLIERLKAVSQSSGPVIQ